MWFPRVRKSHGFDVCSVGNRELTQLPIGPSPTNGTSIPSDWMVYGDFRNQTCFSLIATAIDTYNY